MRVRPPAVAGTFYPADEDALRQAVERLVLDAGTVRVPGRTAAPKAIVVPHAGYVYSGPFAALAYAAVAPRAGEVTRVVLVGPAHRFRLDGMAVPAAEAFQTPLGRVPVDAELRARVTTLADVVVDDRPHADEHSLEVQLPFLQTVLPEFSCLPVAVGRCSTGSVRMLLEMVWGGPETLIVVSSDLSHYLTAPEARQRDGYTVAAIEACHADLAVEQACGARGVGGLLELARQRHLAVTTLGWGNSSDTAGDADRVVGYAAFGVTEPGADDADRADDADAERADDDADEAGADEAPDSVGEYLSAVARASIAEGLVDGRPRFPDPDTIAGPVAERRGSFVTLRLRGALRGCVGTVEAEQPLAVDVAHNAWRAAFADPRFRPLTEAEWPDVTISIALLSALEPLAAASRAELVAALRPEHDGLVIATGAGRATFLPAVWDQLPDPGDFVDRLWRKAGLEPGTWPNDIRTWRYTAEELAG